MRYQGADGILMMRKCTEIRKEIGENLPRAYSSRACEMGRVDVTMPCDIEVAIGVIALLSGRMRGSVSSTERFANFNIGTRHVPDWP